MSHLTEWKSVYEKLHSGGRPPNISVIHAVNREDNHTVPLSADSDGHLDVNYPKGQGSWGNVLNNSTLAQGASAIYTFGQTEHALTYANIHIETSEINFIDDILVEFSTEDNHFFPAFRIGNLELLNGRLFITVPNQLVKGYFKMRFTNLSTTHDLTDCYISIVGY